MQNSYAMEHLVIQSTLYFGCLDEESFRKTICANWSESAYDHLGLADLCRRVPARMQVQTLYKEQSLVMMCTVSVIEFELEPSGDQ